MCFLALDCGAWGTDSLLISWEDLDSFVFVPVALTPQVIQDDHLQVQSHHGCTRIAKDSSGDLEGSHLQVQIHHDGHGGCSWLWDLVDLCTNLHLRLLCGDLLRYYFSRCSKFP